MFDSIFVQNPLKYFDVNCVPLSIISVFVGSQTERTFDVVEEVGGALP